MSKTTKESRPTDLKLAPKPPAAPPAAAGEVSYAFPTKSRCPRCQSLNTKRRGVNGATQYRECCASVCKHKYSIVGEKV